jgi:ubiquitin-like modifier-activating enzyme ATG7
LVPFASAVESSFWVKYCREKLDNIRLNEDPIDFLPFFTPTSNRLCCHELALANGSDGGGSDNVGIDGNPTVPPTTSFNERIAVHGRLLGYNSIENFTATDKNQILRDEFLPHFLGSNDDDGDGDAKALQSLTRAVLLAFADLKSFRVVYWFAFPTFPTPIQVERVEAVPDRIVVGTTDVALRETLHDLRCQHPEASLFPYFLICGNGSDEGRSSYALSKGAYESIRNKGAVIFGFFDPTRVTGTSSAGDGSHPAMGWPLRNLVAYLSFHLNLGGQTVRVLSYRPHNVRRMERADHDVCSIDAGDNECSLLLEVLVPTQEEYGVTTGAGPQAAAASLPVVGWELNARGKSGPRMVNLRPLLDPKHLAIQAADLNLKLMKWRMIPNLRVDLLQNLRVLVIGAGTLGCTVSRVLLGWGIRNFTIVDNSTVSYSNPVRQSLFTLEDCASNAPKAEAAARALGTIAADVSSQAHVLSIPMPGHPERDQTGLEESVERLDAMVRDCDVVFLLTDTRESRWLPTVAAAAHNKMLINAALGLDSWLVMRHGGGFETPDNANRLGCYFCNDVVAPENSTRNRTLDQQCTVTRPGLAPIASSMAVELMVALCHHPDRLSASPPPASATTRNFSPTISGVGSSTSSSSELGLVPHQIRGSLVSYTMMTPTVPAFVHCTACSRPVVEAYQDNKSDLVIKACSSTDGAYLEDLAGLSEFRAQTTARLEELMEEDWDDDES